MISTTQKRKKYNYRQKNGEIPQIYKIISTKNRNFFKVSYNIISTKSQMLPLKYPIVSTKKGHKWSIILIRIWESRQNYDILSTKIHKIT